MGLRDRFRHGSIVVWTGVLAACCAVTSSVAQSAAVPGGLKLQKPAQLGVSASAAGRGAGAGAGAGANTATSGTSDGTSDESAPTTAAPEGAATAIGNGGQPGQPTAPTPQTAAKIAALPAPFPPGLIHGLNVPAQSNAVVAHLNEVVRYYRMALVPIQKVGEPSDLLFVEQSQAEATQIGQLAFQAARGQAAFLLRIPEQHASGNKQTGEAGRNAAILRQMLERVAALRARSDDLAEQIARARAADRAGLQDQKSDIDGQLRLVTAVAVALQKVALTSTSESDSLQADIDRLQHSVPELTDSAHKPVASSVESFASQREAGVVTQATLLFQLLGAESAIGDREAALQHLHDQANRYREPLIAVLKDTLRESQAFQSASSAGGSVTGSAGAATTRTKQQRYDDLADVFTTMSEIAVPLTQEVLLLEQAQATYGSWRSAVAAERRTVLHALLLRVGAISLSLLLLFTLSEVWRRTATRYVQDTRRRRHLLLIRRIVIGFLTGIILIFGFVTQFNSLATFAGFISAGIAVGLQTILLSVAAYFFIVGRYGVKVGDRITVAGVTGEVIEVGLVRFYMLELTGSGTELRPTGRIAVFANSVLFQTGTPLYKQIPGTDYAWHELSVKFKAKSNYGPVLQRVQAVVQSVFDTYKEKLQEQHRNLETSIDTAIQAPALDARIQLADLPVFAVLYPVELANAAEVDQKIIELLFQQFATDEEAAKVIDGMPSVRAVVKS